MHGQPRAQPGMWRTVGVHVGNYRAPESGRVPALMDMMLRYARKTADPPPVAAAWGHARFEAIHPFADGNGRTGRAMIQQQLRAPLPLSVWILARRGQYYAMLANANWESYLEWFLKGIEETCRIIDAGEFAEYAAQTMQDAVIRATRTFSE